jgi:phosphonoacetaldehyde hydrolase
MQFLKAVILDWAGTTVDHGSLAPLRTIQSVFAEDGVTVSEDDARMDMGLPKRDHIRNLLGRIGHDNSEPEVERYYMRFIPRQMEMLELHSAVIPGVVEAVADIRKRGLKIGSTTGYTRPMLDRVAELAAAQGYVPDCHLTPEDAGAGRPHPFMIYEAAARLQVYPLWTFVKVGDTPSDIDEGYNAGTWTVGVADTGNMIGLSLEDFHALSPIDREERSQAARKKLEDAGAQFVIGGVSELGQTLAEIEQRMAQGWRP